jgi:hypothetical protein
MKISGLKLRQSLENELGLESDRARELPVSKTAQEISILWGKNKLPDIGQEGFTALAKAGLLAGVAGMQKIETLLYKFIPEPPASTDLSQIKEDISALAKKRQSVLNLSRHRSTCVNAHLNVLDPEKLLERIYSAYLPPAELKKYKARSNDLLKKDISNKVDLAQWIKNSHELLRDITTSARGDSLTGDESDFELGKGIISEKALPTYLKQWDAFLREKIGPDFGLVFNQEDSPLTEQLRELETAEMRSWTTIVNDMTEAKMDPQFQKRITSHSQTRTSTGNEIISSQFPVKDKTCTIQRSLTGLSKEFIGEFIEDMYAQLEIYKGNGIFSASMSMGRAIITVSLPAATKADLKQVEAWLVKKFY